ncbi:Tannase/feruloyl esterase [Stachybotrys elegans]|uniref:Carboxylic ester hydrolase n=1 Tax=Stachybotrys elegans TaxID=80388 RepID=A0A8K0SP19_9HYPO|nr:Tannase/feruloyl esterase [Stachybotrys elegans]
MKTIGLALLALGSSLGVSHGQTACANLRPPTIPGATILRTEAREVLNYHTGGFEAAANGCVINTWLTHGNSGDEVLVRIWLPLQGRHEWNGYLNGIGGARFSAGECTERVSFAEATPANLARLGYASVCTDAGVGHIQPGNTITWAHNQQLLRNFAYLSVHEMTVIAKAIANDYFGRPPSHSFFFGVGRGGQQGYIAAERYPKDFDGILADGAYVDYARTGMASFWPYLVQHDRGFVDRCSLNAIAEAAIRQCGGFESPDCPGFDAQSLANTVYMCPGGRRVTITAYDASVWTSLHEGPFGNGSYGTHHAIIDSEWATEPPNRSFFTSQYITDFLLNDPDYDYSNIDQDQYMTLWEQSVAEWTAIWGTNTDLAAFRARGGKFWAIHNRGDDIVPVSVAVDHLERLRDVFSQAELNDFYRLTIRPQAYHRGYWYWDFEPRGDLASLINWVVSGTAPSV